MKINQLSGTKPTAMKKNNNSTSNDLHQKRQNGSKDADLVPTQVYIS